MRDLEALRFEIVRGDTTREQGRRSRLPWYGRCSLEAAITRRVSIAFLLALSVAGCIAPQPNGPPAIVATKGIVAASYVPLPGRAAAAAPTSASLRVADFEHAPAEVHTATGWLATAFVPLVGLVNPPVGTARNALHYPDDHTATGFRPGELETIVADEIAKASIFSRVAYGGQAADLELRGTIDLRRAMYAHLAGLGFLAASPWFMWLPLETVDDSCTASFQLVSNDGASLMEKTYGVRAKTRIGIANSDDEWANYGRALFPQLVAQLVHDLAAYSASRQT